MLREVAVIVNCVMCDSYMMLVVDVVNLAESRGSKGKKGKGKGKGKTRQEERDDEYEKIQLRVTNIRGLTVICATCVECCNGLRFQEYIARTPADLRRTESEGNADVSQDDASKTKKNEKHRHTRTTKITTQRTNTQTSTNNLGDRTRG